MKKIVLLALMPLLGISCMSEKFLVSPPFTTSDQIVSLQAGMTLDEVNNTLGIAPYEVLSNVGGEVWTSYHFRVKNYIVPITSFAQGLDNAGANRKPTTVDDLSSQNKGDLQFGEWGTLFVHFSDGKFKSAISEKGMHVGNEVQIIEGSLNNHNQNGVVYMINDKPYAPDAEGVLQGLENRRCKRNECKAGDSSKSKNK
jgi:hypothetical protein